MIFVALTDQERRLLEDLIARAALSNEARRARALLWLDEGENPKAVAIRLGASRQTVYNWASRFKRRSRECDIQTRLADGKRSGRPPKLSANIDSLIVSALDRPPHEFGYRGSAQH